MVSTVMQESALQLWRLMNSEQGYLGTVIDRAVQNEGQPPFRFLKLRVCLLACTIESTMHWKHSKMQWAAACQNPAGVEDSGSGEFEGAYEPCVGTSAGQLMTGCS